MSHVGGVGDASQVIAMEYPSFPFEARLALIFAILSGDLLSSYGVICAVATLERIYTKYGYHVLDRTLRLCVGTWEGDIDSLGANVLAGVARMVVAFGDQLRDETFKERVGFMSVRQLSRIAKERGAGSLCYAEAMLVAYNRKCKYTLRMTKLHSGKVAAEDDFVEENEEPLADDPVLEE